MYRKAAVFFCMAAMFLFAVSCSLIGIVLPSVIGEYHITLQRAGIVTVAQNAGGMAALAVSGVLADRFGKLKVIIGLFAAMTTALLACFVSHSFWSFVLIAMVLGLAASALNMCISAYLSDLYPENSSFYVNLGGVLFGAGSVAGPIYASAAERFLPGWRIWFGLLGIACIASGILLPALGRLLTDPAKAVSGPSKAVSSPAKTAFGPAETASGPAETASGPAEAVCGAGAAKNFRIRHKHIKDIDIGDTNMENIGIENADTKGVVRAQREAAVPIGLLFKDRRIWLYAAAGFFYMAHSSAFMAWIPTYLSAKAPEDPSVKIHMMTIYWISILAGRILTTCLAGRIRYRSYMICANVLGCLAVLGLTMAGVRQMPFLFVFIGVVTASVFQVCLAQTCSVFSVCSGTAGSVVAFCASAGGTLACLLTGMIAEQAGFNPAIAFLGLVLLLCAGVTLIPEKG